MRNKKFISILISLLTVIIMMSTVCATVYATDQGEITPLPDDSQNVATEATQEVTEATQPPTDPPTEEETEPQEPQQPQTEQPQQEETKAQSNYDVYGDDLPQVSGSEVQIPTTMKVPEVEVSDTSLLGGVIAWLCVAVGIAVIAGVLVSQRTRQVSSGDSRRR